MTRPLHYSTYVTKKVITLILAGVWLYCSIGELIAFVFLRNAPNNRVCIAAYLLSSIGYYFVIVLNFVLCTIAIVITYILVIIQLKRRNREMRSLTNNVNNQRNGSINDRMTRVLMLTLNVYITLYFPSALLTCIQLMLPESIYMDIATDIALLAYFLNTLVNPIIYWNVMSDFRDGYKNMLLCRRVPVSRNTSITLPRLRNRSPKSVTSNVCIESVSETVN